MTDYKGPEWAVGLEAHLDGLKSNTGGMTALRRGRGKDPDNCIEMHRYVSGHVRDNQVGTGREWAVYTVASQFALYKDLPHCDQSLGWSLGKAASAVTLSEAGIERRLIQLTRSRTSDELCRRLPRVISLVASASVPISWPRLAGDIDRWDIDRGATAKRWLRDFFNPFNNSQKPQADAITEGAI
jgi:CRISPR type I-E-associated protein CasB/Cse2